MKADDFNAVLRSHTTVLGFLAHVDSGKTTLSEAVLYTAGAWVYARKGFRYHHMVWHLLINLAAICHFTAIVFYLY